MAKALRNFTMKICGPGVVWSARHPGVIGFAVSLTVLEVSLRIYVPTSFFTGFKVVIKSEVSLSIKSRFIGSLYATSAINKDNFSRGLCHNYDNEGTLCKTFMFSPDTSRREIDLFAVKLSSKMHFRITPFRRNGVLLRMTNCANISLDIRCRKKKRRISHRNTRLMINSFRRKIQIIWITAFMVTSGGLVRYVRFTSRFYGIFLNLSTMRVLCTLLYYKSYE